MRLPFKPHLLSPGDMMNFEAGTMFEEEEAMDWNEDAYNKYK